MAKSDDLPFDHVKLMFEISLETNYIIRGHLSQQHSTDGGILDNYWKYLQISASHPVFFKSLKCTKLFNY